MRRRHKSLGKAVAAGAAIAAGPRGLRRLLGIAIVIGLLSVLAVAALVVAIGKAGSAGSGPLPCAPDKVNVRYSTSNTPQWAKEVVEKALKDTKRKPRTVTEAGDDRDLMIVYWPTSESAEPKLSGTTLRLDKQADAEEVKKALQAKLEPCQDVGRTTDENTGAKDGPDALEEQLLGWNSPVVWIGGVLTLWWACGPTFVRLMGKGVTFPSMTGDNVDADELLGYNPEPTPEDGAPKMTHEDSEEAVGGKVE